MSTTFGEYVRKKRQVRYQTDADFSLRKVSKRIGVQPAYLSQIERSAWSPPSEEKILALAKVLGEDPDVLLAMAGKVSKDLQAIICRRPALFAQLIRELKKMPEDAVLRLVREVRDGTW